MNQTSSQEFGEAEESEESDNSSSESNTDYSCESDDDKEQNDGEDEQNHSNTSSNCTSGSENTTHSYPSSLLEEEDDIHPIPNLEKLNLSTSLSDLNNGISFVLRIENYNVITKMYFRKLQDRFYIYRL